MLAMLGDKQGLHMHAVSNFQDWDTCSINIRGMNDGWTSLKFFSYIFASACILLLFISITSFRIYDVQMNKSYFRLFLRFLTNVRM